MLFFIGKRLQTYVSCFTRFAPSSLPPPPPGFTHFADELESIANAFKLIMMYNHSIFGDYFTQVLTKENTPDNGVTEEGGNKNDSVASVDGVVDSSESLPNIKTE